MSNITINIREATHEIRRMNRDLSKSVIDAAIVSALNHTIRKGKTAAGREIRKVYKIKSRDLNKQLSIKRAYKQNKQAAIIALGRPIGVISFGARKRRDGVSVNIMGKRKVIKSAFIAKMKSGHVGVFARGHYPKAGNFRFRKTRLKKKGNDNPIQEIKTFKVPTAIANDAVLKHVTRKLEQDFPKRLIHEINRRRR